MTLLKRFVCIILGLAGPPHAIHRGDFPKGKSSGVSDGEDGVASRSAPQPDRAAGEPAAPWFDPPGADLLEPLPLECPDLTHEARAVMNGLECTLENGDVVMTRVTWTKNTAGALEQVREVSHDGAATWSFDQKLVYVPA